MQHSLLVTITIWWTCFTWAVPLSLGGRAAYFDSGTNTWLCCVPPQQFDNDLTVRLTVDTTLHWSDIAVNGMPLPVDSIVTFTDIAGDKAYPLTAVDTITGDTLHHTICFTYLPILHLQGEFNDDYQVTYVGVSLPEADTASTMFARVKHRGATTNLPGRHKRNYHIKFLDADSQKMDRKFFGLRNDNSWLLDAGQIDMLRIRNRVCIELWLDMCRKPYYADEEPKALLGVRGDMVEVFLNDRYNGIYALTEAMDRKQMKLVKSETDSTGKTTFHGMLWKTKVADGITRMTRWYGYNNDNDTWGGLEVKYPDPDDVMPTDYKTISNAFKFVFNSSHASFVEHVGEYFDLPVVMDYWIMINTLLAVDNGAKNIYWAVYDQTIDKKLTLAAWDLDCTVGQNWINVPPHNEEVVGPTRQLSGFNNLLLRLHEHNPDSFCIKAVERYRLLRNDLLSADSIYHRFENRVNWLKRCGAVARETARWTCDSDLSGNPLDFDNELAYIRQWLDSRLDYLDKGRFAPYVRGDMNRDGVVDIVDVNHTINRMLNATDYPMWYEDLVRDYVTDIADLNAVINLMLGK